MQTTQPLEKNTTSRRSLWHTRLQQLIQRLLRLFRADVLKSAIDSALIIIAACWTWFVSFSQVADPGSPLPFLTIVVLARVLLYRIFRLDLLSWFNVSRHDVLWIAISAVLGIPLILLAFLLLPEPFTLRAMTRPQLILITEPALYTLLLCAARITARAAVAQSNKAGNRRVLIVGAGDAGLAIAFQI